MNKYGKNFVHCRCEAFNKVMKNYNFHTNRQACSRDIATRFAKVETLQLLCGSERLAITVICTGLVTLA